MVTVVYNKKRPEKHNFIYHLRLSGCKTLHRSGPLYFCLQLFRCRALDEKRSPPRAKNPQHDRWGKALRRGPLVGTKDEKLLNAARITAIQGGGRSKGHLKPEKFRSQAQATVETIGQDHAMVQAHDRLATRPLAIGKPKRCFLDKKIAAGWDIRKTIAVNRRYRQP